MSDLEKAMHGDKEAFSRVIIQNKEAMYKTAIVILKNEDDAYDALQEALIKMYRNISKLENKEAFNFWSRRIIVNCCYDIINKNKRVVDITTKIAENVEETREDIYDCEDSLVQTLEKIEPDLRLTVTLYYYNDLSTKEIAEILINIVKKLDKRIKQYKKEYDLFEFSDIAKLALNLLNTNEEVLKKYQNKYKNPYNKRILLYPYHRQSH